MKKKILCIIPARKGSKGLKNKNFQLFNGKRLLSYPLSLSNKLKIIDHVVFTSDSNQYLNYVKKNFNCETIKRSKKLSNDNSKIRNVIKFILKYLKKKKSQVFDIILMLEPTSPLTSKKDILKAIKILERQYNKVDSVCPVVEINKYNPVFSMKLKKNFFSNKIMPNNIHRQDDKTFFLSGNFYLSKVSSFIKNNGFYSKKTYAYIVDKKYYTDIDDKLDFKLAEIQKKIFKIK